MTVQPTNMQPFEKSRKRPKVGDVFVIHIPQAGFLFGRLISTEAVWTHSSSAKGANLVYIYAGSHGSPEATFNDSPDNLLIAPIFTNNLPWSRGYFKTIRNEEIQPHQKLSRHAFKSFSQGKYFDELGRQVLEPQEPIGVFALDSFATIDDQISDALGIPRAS